MGEEFSTPAVHTRPIRRIALDVETTGLLPYDRVVTLGAVRIDGSELMLSKALHLVFDPRKDSSEDAITIHGWDNWTTRFQDLFCDLAPLVHRWLSWADEVVCHNAAFDLQFVDREIRKADLEALGRPAHCTMVEARGRWPGMPASLDACVDRVGLRRATQRHGALEDALLTAALFLKTRGATLVLPPLDRLPGPRNFVPPPPAPEGVLPRRSVKRPGESPSLSRFPHLGR